MKDAPEASWHVKFDSQNLKHSGDLARWSTIAHRPSPSPPMKVRLNPNITSLGSELQLKIHSNVQIWFLNPCPNTEILEILICLVCHNFKTTPSRKL